MKKTLIILTSVVIAALFIGTSMTTAIARESAVGGIAREVEENVLSEEAQVVEESECIPCGEEAMQGTTQGGDPPCDNCHDAVDHAVAYAQTNNPFPVYTGQGPFPVIQFINDIIIWAISIPGALYQGLVDSGFLPAMENLLGALGAAVQNGVDAILEIIDENPFDAGFGYGLVFFLTVLDSMWNYICNPDGGDGGNTQSAPASAPVSAPAATQSARASASASAPAGSMSI